MTYVPNIINICPNKIQPPHGLEHLLELLHIGCHFCKALYDLKQALQAKISKLQSHSKAFPLAFTTLSFLTFS